MSEILDEKLKSFLTACLVTGIDVESKPDAFMAGLVNHMNSTERIYWAEGDEDGIIIHNKNDNPLLYIIYNGKRMTFRSFDEDEFTAMSTRKEIGFALLNIIGFFQEQDLKFGPSILGSEAHVVEHLRTAADDGNSEDWAL